MGYNDPVDVREPSVYGDYTLEAIVDGTLLEDAKAVDDPREMPMAEFAGFHFVPQPRRDAYLIQPDGYAGPFRVLNIEVVDTVPELINTLRILEMRFFHEYDEETRIEQAGKIMTGNKERADEEPDKYLYVPDEPADVDG